MKFGGLKAAFERWSSSRMAAILVLASTLLLTGIATAYVAVSEKQNDEVEFENAVQQTRDAIEERVNIYLALLRGATAMFEVHDRVSEEDFHEYVDHLRLDKNYPGITAIAVAVRVDAGHGEQFLKETRQQNPSFEIRPPGERATYFPVIYVEPMNSENAAAVGMDLFTEEARHRAMSHARDIGKAAISTKVTLMQDSPAEEREGFGMYVPVFGQGAVPRDLWERRKQLRGFVCGGFRAAELFAKISPSETDPPLHFEVYDGVLTRPENLLYSSAAQPSARRGLTTQQRLDVPGHIWTLVFQATASFEGTSSQRWALWIFGFGSGMSLILFLVTDAFGRIQRRAARSLAAANATLEQRVEERTSRLKESIADLEHFSYSITHDMRAPLRAMQGYAQLLAEGSDKINPDARREYLRRIAAAAERMDKLILDSLNYAKVVRNEVKIEAVDPGCLLREMLESYPQFQPPKAEIRLEGDFPRVMANEVGLSQCFSNLLGNAVKFVARGIVPSVRIRTESKESRVRILFEDNGIGIARESQERIFEMFQRLHRQDEYEGTGIGLAMVRKIAARMGGSVGVESHVGRGSTFWLELAGAEVREGHHSKPTS